MQHTLSAALLTAATLSLPAAMTAQSQAGDSLYLHAYTTSADNYHTGLHLRWSADQVNWFDLGQQHAFVKSDYGTWGSQKRMLAPQLTRQADGSFLLLFRVGEADQHVAVTTSPDLIHWLPQDYYLTTDSHITQLGVSVPDVTASEGSYLRISRSELSAIQTELLRASAASRLNDERAIDDARRYAALGGQPVATSITIGQEGSRQISDKLMGIFFEDISYAADGGLYAEMVQNRDFEYSPRDRRHQDPKWTATYAWTLTDAQGHEQGLTIGESDPLHPNNPHHAVIAVDRQPLTLSNSGWDGISLKAGARYDLSLQVLTRQLPTSASTATKPIAAQLIDAQGNVIAQGRLSGTKSGKWSQLKCTLRANADASGARLALTFDGQCEYLVDMVSLFPQDTYKGRKNGMRRDLAETLEALHPRFVRFPGGCIAHGDGLDNLYRWKNTIGPLEARVPNWNIWRYHQTVGLGYYEYFQFCEDLGAEPLPVLAAAVPCQNSCVGTPGNEFGQQGGIPMGAEMDAYIQDVLDLIEWANGDPKTSKWARMRAEAGHPKPFNLKMVGIGNEDLISQTFKERFRLIYQAVRQQYPDIEVVGTVGPFYEGSDYDEGWRLAHELAIPTVDEHYYNTPGWFINNQQFYDLYPRRNTKVYLGEYAAHVPNRANNIETALAEAMHLCNVERNADLVTMTSYAPLLARTGHTSWNPDLIYFDNDKIMPTTGYEVQRIFGQYSGSTWLPQQVQVTVPEPADRKAPRASEANVARRIATSCVFDAVSGNYIIRVVNYLPVANRISLALPFIAQPQIVSAEQLTGTLDALNVKALPASDQFTTDGNQLISELPAYSFTVVVVRAE